MCSCGCNTCEIRGPLLTEGRVRKLVSENLQYHINENVPLMESVFRIGSNAHLSVIKEARKLYSRGVLDLCEEDEGIIKTHLGEFDLYEDTIVPLDLPMINEEEQLDEKKKAKKKKKDPPIGKPKRGGSKAYYVYVRDPKTKRIKKVSFGSGGLRAKIRNPKARKAFAARHKCSQKTDRTKASYWSCRLPRYASQLGLGANMNTFW
tara:strand:+ start:2336 stop:2953 length:618 start_codon:yes stop_codon:yes gene_type:complete